MDPGESVCKTKKKSRLIPLLMNTILHPAYFPPVAHFVALVNTRVVFETADNYQKQTYRNRMYVYGPNGRQLLTVPVKHTGKNGRQRYKDVKIEYAFNWRKQHWKTLETLYRSSPFFEFYEDDIRPVFSKAHPFLTDLTLETIATVCNCLQMDFSPETTKAYQETIPGATDLRTLTDAKTGFDPSFEEYSQVFGERYGFMSNLSILDLLFNLGPAAVAYLERQNLSSINNVLLF